MSEVSAQVAPTRPRALSAGDLPQGVWSKAVPIPFGRCDPAGIVYTPHYFDLFIGAVEAWYAEALDIDYYALLRERRIGLGYGHAACDFFAPTLMGECWTVAIVIERVGRSSVTLVLHAMVDGEERARGRLVSVATSIDERRAIPLPDDVRRALQCYRDRCGG